ncbi:kinase-like domain-containing protein [Colletotrichum lupini]|nr:kinase-like domain-containing protein [Colletotrichum lupini]
MSRDNTLNEEPMVSLGDKLCQRFEKSKFDEREPSFLPEGCIEDLITEHAISRELFDLFEDEAPPTPEKALIRFVHEKAKKVFAIVVCCGTSGTELLTTIKFFKTNGFKDSDLPIKKPGTPRAHVAIKEILVNNDRRDEIEKNYEDERKALSEITDLRHKHIIQRIAAITRGERRYFMFQWADGGNLREFWKEKTRPVLTSVLVKETVTQLLGLADALHALHNYKNQGNYRHGDLKPENILRFRNETVVGILKIADMGLAKHHNDNTAVRKKATSAKYGAVRYEPPEVVTNRLDKARSRLYDIWSMGCIMLECIIWLLYGCEALDKFDDSLSNDGYDCSFFKIREIDGARVAEVHPVVVLWMDSMANDRQCCRDSAIGDLLNLVRSRLLVVPLLMQAPTRILNGAQTTTFIENQPDRRISVTSASQNTPESGPYRADAGAMRSGLDKILRKADNNETYLSIAQDRRNINGPPSLTIPRSQITNLLSPEAAEKPRGNTPFLGALQAQHVCTISTFTYFH